MLLAAAAEPVALGYSDVEETLASLRSATATCRGQRPPPRAHAGLDAHVEDAP